MQSSRRPSLHAAALSRVPAPILAHMTRVLVRRMRRRHPRLVAAFGRLDPAVVHLAPTDLPHRFALTFGHGGMDIHLLRTAKPPPADATIRGSLMVLIDLLEGRIDGDSTFFSRDIEITGSTAVIVAVRNTLDGEEIVMRDDIASLFGPLEPAARRVARRLDAMIGGMRARAAELHASLHAGEAPERDLAAECDALHAEVKALKTRLAKLDVRQLRASAAATGATGTP